MNERLVMSGFFEELKRRKVYRVAIAYVVASWALAQGIAQLLPVFDIPNSRIRVVILLLLIGFPIALILAWAFDITPQGVRVTEPLPSTPSRHRGRRNLFILLAVGLIVSAIAGFFILPRASANKLEKSIAVLPFENFSDDKENAYFADGIQDDILTNLAKIGDLKVISRTSVMGYRGKTDSVRDIGKSLGVAAVLEGSVRRSGNRVRVNVQLINAANDEHIWAEDYDRDLTDVFALQSELAQEIASQLQAKLSPSEKAQLTRKPTENGEAYLAFVQAFTLQNAVEDLQKLKQSEQLYARAIQLDSNFALASARYSQLESWIFHSYSTPEARDNARTLAKRALELQPDLPEAHLALGFAYYYCDLNYEAALGEFEIARRGLPNQMDAYLALGAIKRRQGRWTESTADLDKAVSLSPKDSWPLQNLTFNYAMLRDFARANETVDRALGISPKSFGLWEIKSTLALLERGDLSVAQNGLAELEKAPQSPEIHAYVLEARARIFLLQRKYSEALQAAENWPDDSPHSTPESRIGKQILIGCARKGLGDESGARLAFTKARELAQATVNTVPDDAGQRARLALAFAFLGEKDSALAEAKRAMDLLPESKDAFDGPKITEAAAQVSCIVGDHARSLELIDGLLTRPAQFTVESLKFDPIWDPMRNDPGFQALLGKHGGKTS